MVVHCSCQIESRKLPLINASIVLLYEVKTHTHFSEAKLKTNSEKSNVYTLQDCAMATHHDWKCATTMQQVLFFLLFFFLFGFVPFQRLHNIFDLKQIPTLKTD